MGYYYSQRLAGNPISDFKHYLQVFIRVHENKRGHFKSGPNP